jgi:hypothetical protein
MPLHAPSYLASKSFHEENTKRHEKNMESAKKYILNYIINNSFWDSYLATVCPDHQFRLDQLKEDYKVLKIESGQFLNSDDWALLEALEVKVCSL